MSTPTSVPEWPIVATDPVPVRRWGEDHWSTLAYLETRIVDHHGMVDHRQLRTDHVTHPIFAEAGMGTFSTPPTTRYPTRLKAETPDSDGKWGVVELPGHDDYDCITDAIAAGLVQVHMPVAASAADRYRDVRGHTVTDLSGGPLRPSWLTGLRETELALHAHFTLTDTGRAIAGQLRAWKRAARQVAAAPGTQGAHRD